MIDFLVQVVSVLQEAFGFLFDLWFSVSEGNFVDSVLLDTSQVERGVPLPEQGS